MNNQSKYYLPIAILLLAVVQVFAYIFIHDSMELSDTSSVVFNVFMGFSITLTIYLFFVYFQLNKKNNDIRNLIKKTNQKYELSDIEIQKEIDKLNSKIEQSSSIDKDIEKEIAEQIKALELNKIRNTHRKIKELSTLLETV